MTTTHPADLRHLRLVRDANETPRLMATLRVDWDEDEGYEDEETGEVEPGTSGYYVHTTTEAGGLRSVPDAAIGPEPGEDDGYESYDDAIAAAVKWARDRGLAPEVRIEIKCYRRG